MKLIEFRPYEVSNKGARTGAAMVGACGACRRTGGGCGCARTGATAIESPARHLGWTNLGTALKHARDSAISFTAVPGQILKPKLKLWPTFVSAPTSHVGADTTSTSPTIASPITTATTTIADVAAIALGGAASGAAGYFIGGATKSTWVPVLSGSIIGAMSRIGIILGGIIAYAGVHYARK